MRTLVRILAALLCGLAAAQDTVVDSTTGLAPGSLNPAKRGLVLPAKPKVMVVPIKDDESTKYGMMDEWQAMFLERRLKRAERENCGLVILEIDTNGGSVGAVEQMNKAISKCRVPVIAFVTGKAFSAGALLSLGCKAVVMAPGTQIGGAKIVSLLGDLGADMRQKADSMARAMVTNLAEANNYPLTIALGMVDSGVEVYEVSWPESPAEGPPALARRQPDRQRFVTGEELKTFEQNNAGKPRVVEQWKKKDEILTLTARRAVDAGLASGQARDTGEIFTGLNINPSAVETASVTASESAARMVSHPLWRVLLVVIGLVALFWEMKAPGHGVGYILFAFCLGLFFWMQFFANNAGLVELALFGLGAVLVAVELFILPSFGFPGFIGFALMLASIVLSFLPDSVSISILWQPNYGGASYAEKALLTEGLGWAALTLVLIIALVITGFVRGAKLPGLSRLALRSEVPQPAGLPAIVETQAAPGSAESLAGQYGLTETVLRPSGKVRLGEKTYEAVSESAFLEQGVKVVVLRVAANSLVVREAGPKNTTAS
jgi:membrane-bound serine protease (ClpP class)